MKTTATIAIVVLISLNSFSQKMKLSNMHFVNSGTIAGKADSSQKVPVGAFYMSNEVTNKEYREFINALKSNPDDSLGLFDIKKYKETSDAKTSVKFYSYREILGNIIDSTAWDNDPGFKNYFTDKKFDNYPVVGVSYMNALFYCAWRTDMENMINEKSGSFIMDFRLPTETEWEYVAANSPLPAASERSKEIDKVNSGKKNPYGLHHLNGNVAEWTSSASEKGENIIKGSSWKTNRQTGERMLTNADFRDNATGFRMVMTHIRVK